MSRSGGEEVGGDAPLAWIDGAPASPTAAASEAARLLRASRQPLLTGLGVDIDGARAAIALTERVGGVIDHVASAALLRDLDCQREGGAMITSPNEARVRADVVVLVGDGLEATWPSLGERLLAAPLVETGKTRHVFWLAPSADEGVAGFTGDIDRIAVGRGAHLAVDSSVLRARIKGRALRPPAAPDIERLAQAMLGAAFGVVVWSAEHLRDLEVEMLNGLVRDLNDTTRFSSLPLSPADDGAGVLAACGWMTGFPMRTGFGALGPAHDPWRYDGERLIAAGETDCVMWIHALGAGPPSRVAGALDIAVCESEIRLARTPRVRFTVARPGRDHDAVLHSADTGTLVAVRGAVARRAPSAAEAIALIAGSLDDGSGRAC